MLLAELEPLLDRERENVMEALAAFEPQERELDPPDGGWNVVKVIEHVGMIEAWVAHKLRKLLDSEEPRPAEPVEDKVTDMIYLMKENGLFGVKIEAPERAQPTGTIGYEEGLARLKAVREQLKAMLPELASRETNSLQSWHPLGFNLNPCQWAHFAAVHESMHLRQLRRIREQLSASQR